MHLITNVINHADKVPAVVAQIKGTLKNFELREARFQVLLQGGFQFGAFSTQHTLYRYFTGTLLLVKLISNILHPKELLI